MAKHTPHVLRPVNLAIGVVAIIALTGCQHNVFPPDQPRSQYDRFDLVRDQRAQSFVEDEFGYRKPNLRGRLLNAE